VSKLRSKKGVALATAALALAAGGGAALAASQGEGPSATSFLDAVARHLGVSRDELEEATKAAALEQVDSAVEAGRITEAQADALRSRIESDEFPPFFGPFFGGFHGGLHAFGQPLSAAADYLELTVEQLRERLGRGQSLADIAVAQGKSVDGLKQALIEDATRRFDEAVEEGKLTEDQARTMLDRLESRMEEIVAGDAARLRSGPRLFVPRPHSPFRPRS
jgi:hypothetical protein